MLITCSAIAQSFLLLVTGPMLGISGGTQAILSYNYGARKTARVKKTERSILLLMLCFTSFMFLVSRIVPQFFVGLFTSNPDYYDFSAWAIQTYTLMIIPLSFQYVFVDGLTALERPKTALCLSIFRKGLYVAATLVLPVLFTAQSAFFAESLADGVSAVLSTCIFLLIINKHLLRREHSF
ncbi:MAG: MATE family efflux transporter [Ruminococcus sp.]|jgi:Na+-driven multidrug efflux pump